MSKAVFISWAPNNTRSTTIGARFGATVYHLHALRFKRVILAPPKYVILGIRTFRILWRERPEFIFVANPPYFSALVVWFYTRLRGGRYVLDSHTGAFLERKWTWLRSLHRFLVRRAAVSIVTNEELGRIVEEWGGRYFVIGDVPTEFDPQPVADLPRPYVTVVNTFSYDEPIEEVLAAAGQLPEVNFAVTGDTAHCPPTVRDLAPVNLQFLGFTSMQEYADRLSSSDLAVVLTTENYTMQRGAYEAVSMGVPVVTSDWPILRETFAGGAVFCDNTADGIARAIREVLDDQIAFRQGVQALRQRRRDHFDRLQADFQTRYLDSSE